MILSHAETGTERIKTIMKGKELKKFKERIERWAEGTQPLVRNLPPVMFHVCIELYNALLEGRKPTFLQDEVRLVLDKCHIHSREHGIGFQAYLE